MLSLLPFLWVIFSIVKYVFGLEEVNLSPCQNVELLYRGGLIDLEAMLYNCSKTMLSSSTISSYYKEYPITVVKSNFALNNLIQIDEIQGTATLDFHFRLSWVDPRWILPDDLFTKLDDGVYYEGIDVMSLASDINLPLYIWSPKDVIFKDIIDSYMNGETLKVLNSQYVIVLLTNYLFSHSLPISFEDSAKRKHLLVTPFCGYSKAISFSIFRLSYG